MMDSTSFPASEKRKIANALLSLNMPHTERFGYKTEEKEVVDVKDVHTPELFAEELPSMSSLVNTGFLSTCSLYWGLRRRDSETG